MVRPKVNSGPILPPSCVGLEPRAPYPAVSLPVPSPLALPSYLPGQVGDPHVVGDGGFAVGAAHLLEQRRGGGIVTDVVEGLDARVALHVRLAGEDEDLEWFRFHADGGEKTRMLE